MKPKKTWKATLCTAICLLALAAVPAAAFNPLQEPPGSVAVGLVSDQFARIAITNSTDRVSGIVPCVCPIQLTILDETGTALASQAMDVVPGEIASFEFDPMLRGGERQLVRALVEFPGGEGERLVCNLGTRSSLEIVQAADGATTVVVPIVTSYLPIAAE